MSSGQPMHLVICPKCGSAIEFEKIVEHIAAHSASAAQPPQEKPTGA
ncbi:MAG: hypothetical protein JRN52_08195 [Nitrososphaerota archaeon]|nr:hypothetical protein [Nitrososphaerota archaeon]